LRLECEIAVKKLIRQTVLGTGSSTGRSYLPVFRVLQTRSLGFAQLFPSAYIKELNPRMVCTVWGFLFAIYAKYIRLQSLCQVKIEVKIIHFLRVKKHLTR